jgi:spore coat protein CotF
MIKNKSLKLVCLIVSVGFTGSVFAYGTSATNNGCKKPKFKTFTPAHKSEVDPESEISFTVSGYADPATIKATAKKIPLEVDTEYKISFYAVKAKLPASLSGKYARIHVQADAMLGCTGKDGWLLKIRDKAAEAE